MNFLNIFIEFIIVDCFFFLSVILNSLVILLSFCIHYFRWEVCWNHIVSPLRMFPWVVFKIFLYLCLSAVWLWCYQVRFLKSCLGFFEHLGSVSQCFWPYLENLDHYFFKCIFLPYSFLPLKIPFASMLDCLKLSLRICVFSPLFFRLDNFYWSVIKFIDSYDFTSFCQALRWNFHFRYFQFSNSHFL